MLNSTSSDIQILSFYNNSGKTVIKSAINICRNFKVNISIHQITVSADHEIWEGMPSSFTSAKAVVLLLNKLSKYNVCIGNPDEEFQDVTVVGAGISHQSSPGIVAYREGDFCASIGAFTYHSTIRSSSCCLLVQHNRCKTCSQYRKSLKLRKQRLNQQAENRQKQGTDLMHSTYKHKDMSREMLTNKLQQQKKHIQTLDGEISKMKRTVERDILQKGVTLGEIQNNEVKDLMATGRPDANVKVEIKITLRDYTKDISLAHMGLDLLIVHLQVKNNNYAKLMIKLSNLKLRKIRQETKVQRYGIYLKTISIQLQNVR
ncbi:Hypothetical predicted protein [Mytilus galloprovincialis]|uniref:Uncharacterized protein n=1 Tax=Mytilus galloprovincialis TaxID=29158 RepID=A0A8B6DAG6_MYTGA|nr:Hypothetical predicted protein [Mytilus galloprovincialis]